MNKYDSYNQRILVLEIDDQSRFLITQALEKAGFEVFATSNSQAALRAIERQGLPHLVVIDWRETDYIC